MSFSQMFGPKMGTYSLSSEIDNRFNNSWRRSGLVCDGYPDWMKEYVANKVKELGILKAPDDLTWSFYKD